jgi:hypothetical protein
MKNQDSLLKQKVKPWFQGVIALGLIVLSQTFFKLVSSPTTDLEKLDYWIIASSYLLFFTLLNSVFSFNSESASKYYAQSVFTFIAVAVLGGYSAYLFSGIALSDASSFSWIYRVLTVIFIVFLTIVNVIRKIVELAKNQNHDKRHNN